MTHTPRRTSFLRQRGQAMTEFVVGAVLFLMPLFLIVPMLGKYSDIKAASAQSARYAAWERTVWYGAASSSNNWPGKGKTEANIQTEARQRIINFGGLITSADANATGYSTDGARWMWRNRDGSKMLQNYTDAKNTVTIGDSPDIATGDVLDTINAFTSILGFDLETRGFYTGTAAIPVTTLPIGASLRQGSSNGKFDPGVLTFRDHNAILANGWGSSGSAHVKTMTAGIAPLGLVGDENLGPALQIAGCVVFALFTPEFCFLELGKIEPDIVPPDRLTGP
jgi:hypothetical protein